MIQFFVNFNTSDFISSSISVGAYLKFVIGILLTFGVIFEMPILSLPTVIAWHSETRVHDQGAVLCNFVDFHYCSDHHPARCAIPDHGCSTDAGAV